MIRKIAMKSSRECVSPSDIAPSGAHARCASQGITGRIGPAFGERRRQIRTHRVAPRQQHDRISEIHRCIIVAIEGIETGDVAPQEQVVEDGDGSGERLDRTRDD